MARRGRGALEALRILAGLDPEEEDITAPVEIDDIGMALGAGMPPSPAPSPLEVLAGRDRGRSGGRPVPPLPVPAAAPPIPEQEPPAEPPVDVDPTMERARREAGPPPETPLEMLLRGAGWRNTPPAPPPPPEPDTGVPDHLAWWLAGDELGMYGEMPSEQTVRETLSWDTVSGDVNDVDEALVQRIMSNLPAVISQGRRAVQRFPFALKTPGGYYTPDSLARALAELAKQRASFLESRYHEQNPNPPFGAARGGPTMAPQMGGPGQPRYGAALADYLEGVGVASPLADIYRQEPVTFDPAVTSPGTFGPSPYWARGGDSPRINLGSFLTQASEPWMIGTGQHEAAHRYQDRQGPHFREVFGQRLSDWVGQGGDASALGQLIRRNPAYQNAPRWEHEYTPPFDSGLGLEELPESLRPFYQDEQGRSLLLQNPALQFLMKRSAGLIHGPEYTPPLPPRGPLPDQAPPTYDVARFFAELDIALAPGRPIYEDELAERLSEWLGREATPAEVGAALDYRGDRTADGDTPPQYDVAAFLAEVNKSREPGSALYKDELAKLLEQWLGRPPTPAEVRAAWESGAGR